jgi:hypothetical protein
MGLIGDWLRGKRMKDPVRGSAQVVACSRWTQGMSANVVMNLVVSAEGIAATPVEHECMCRQDRWPHAGQVLPVTVDRADPSRLKVEWDEVRSHEDRIAEQAEMLAAQMNGSGAGTGDDLVDQLRAAFPGAEITVTSHQPNLADLTGGDSVERLERLAALHRSGALTDEEFAAAKARLLG